MKLYCTALILLLLLQLSLRMFQFIVLALILNINFVERVTKLVLAQSMPEEFFYNVGRMDA